MASAEAAIVGDALLVRLGGATSSRAKDLTNVTKTGTTANTEVLYAAADDAIGDFVNISGVSPDVTLASHLGILIYGTLQKLEEYKGVNISQATAKSKIFYAKCRELGKRKTHTPKTGGGNYSFPTVAAGQIPDMDDRQPAFRGDFNTVYTEEDY